jgi:hypothetical protein
MKFCQTDGTPLVEAAETAVGGDLSGLPNDEDATKTQLFSAGELEKEFGSGEMSNDMSRDVSPPSPFGNSAPSWMDSPDKGLDDFSPSPSPFDEAQSSNYRSPSTPFQEPEPMFGKPQESFNQSPFGNPSSTPFSNQTEWTPPPAPVAEWQNQSIGTNTAFQPPISGQGDDKTLAIVSLVSGILSLTCCWGVAGVVALITGFMAKNNVESNPQQYGGSGFALAGMIMGAISLVLSVLYFIFVIILGVVN